MSYSSSYTGAQIDAAVAKANTSLQDSGNQTITSGNLVIGTSGKGIDFSATGELAGMTSELLNDYEEGTYSPVLTSESGSITSYTSSGKYTKIGRVVILSYTATITNIGTAGGVIFVSVPFTNGSQATTGNGIEISATGVTYTAYLDSNANGAHMYQYNGAALIGQGYSYRGSFVYQV